MRGQKWNDMVILCQALLFSQKEQKAMEFLFNKDSFICLKYKVLLAAALSKRLLKLMKNNCQEGAI